MQCVGRRNKSTDEKCVKGQNNDHVVLKGALLNVPAGHLYAQSPDDS